jgi:hypothetical protein
MIGQLAGEDLTPQGVQKYLPSRAAERPSVLGCLSPVLSESAWGDEPARPIQIKRNIIGKALGQPIYNLLGGRYHEKVRVFGYVRSG